MVQHSRSTSNEKPSHDGRVLGDLEIPKANWIVVEQPDGHQCVAGVYEVQIGDKSARVSILLQPAAVKIVVTAIDKKPCLRVEDVGRSLEFLAHLDSYLKERGRAPDNGVPITFEFPAQTDVQ